MTPTLIGYFPKQTSKETAWLQSPGVKEICSVSECMSKGPKNWINHWRHNGMWVYDTEEIAWDVVPPEIRKDFDLFAYRMIPARFVKGEQEIFEIPHLTVQPLSASFEALGFDAVSRSLGNDFECSPLSCNQRAKDHVVNKYCLVNNLSGAISLGREFSMGGAGAEPGPYYVVEVLRRSRSFEIGP